MLLCLVCSTFFLLLTRPVKRNNYCGRPLPSLHKNRAPNADTPRVQCDSWGFRYLPSQAETRPGWRRVDRNYGPWVVKVALKKLAACLQPLTYTLTPTLPCAGIMFDSCSKAETVAVPLCLADFFACIYVYVS